MRAGARALSLLSLPLNVHVLMALEDEPRPLLDLRRAVGSPPASTMRSHLHAFEELGVVDRGRQSGSADYELGPAGRELLAVADILRAWLAAAPDGPQLGSAAAKSAIKALVDGWSSTIVRALAAGPLSLTELSKLIPRLNYPSLERRLGAMRLAGLIEARPGRTRGTPYAVTDPMRRAIAPLGAAALWEQRHAAAETASIGQIDIESMFLLTVPIAELAADVSGVCRLAVQIGGGNGAGGLAGVLVNVEKGRVTSCVSRLQGNVDAWVLGTAQGWIGALIDQGSGGVEVGGDQELAAAILDALQRAQLADRQRA